VQRSAVMKAWTRTSGVRVSTLGRWPESARKRSQTASLMRKVMNSRLFSGLLIAVTSTRSVCAAPNQRDQGVS